VREILGRLGTPVGFGAYYIDPVVQPIGALGSYEVRSSLRGTETLPYQDQALINIAQSLPPSGAYTPWAERDGDLDWREVFPTNNRYLYVISQDQIKASIRESGEPPTQIVVLARSPLTVREVESAFDTTRYGWSRTEAVYTQFDTDPVPTILFLHWGQLRPEGEWTSRRNDEAFLSRLLNGSLTFPIEVEKPKSDRERPITTFADAFRRQFPAFADQIPPLETAPPPATAQAAATGVSPGILLALGLLVAGGAYAGYRWLK
jgi:hypothetical protein